MAVEAGGIPLAALPAPANQRDDGLLAATLDAIAVVGSLPARPVVHLDAGDDYQPCRPVLAEREMAGQIATRAIPAPIQAGRRWVIERTHAWGNQHGKLRWWTEPPAGGGVLAGPGQRRHCLWPAGPPYLDPRSLARPSSPPPMTTYRRRLLSLSHCP